MSKKKNKKIKEAKIMENNINSEEIITTETTVVEEIGEPIVNGLEKGFEEVNDEIVDSVEEEPTVENNENEEALTELEKENQKEIEETIDFNGTVVPAMLNVRKVPEKDGEVLTIINQGEKVRVNDEINGFYAIITTNGTEGFCVKDFISVD